MPINTKLPIIFSIFNKINITCVMICLGSTLGQGIVNDSFGPNKVSFIAYMIVLIAIFMMFGAYYYFASKLVSRYFNKTTLSTIPNRGRIIFYILEIIWVLFHSWLVYLYVVEFRKEGQVTMQDPLFIFKMASMISFFVIYFTSLFRVIFTWPLYKMIKEQYKLEVQNIGEEI